MDSSLQVHETKSLFSTDKRLLFVLICLATFLLLFIKKSFIENETAAFEFLQDRPEGMILRIISAVQFVSVPLVYLWKFTVIAFVIWVGCFTFGYRVTYSQCWQIVLVAEFIFIVPELLKIAWFLFVVRDPTLNEIHAFYPLSLMHFFDYNTIDHRYAYPLRALNFFEIAYWLLLVAAVRYHLNKRKHVAWIIVSCSYILIFFLWLGFYMIVYK